MLTKKLILATAAGAALLSSSAFADPRWGHQRHSRHWHPYGYVVVNPAPVVVAPYYYAPAPVYVAPPAPAYYSVPAPVYYPAPVYQPAPAVSIGLRLRL